MERTPCSVELLSPFLDDVLPAAEREAIRAHLSACPDCYTRLESLRALKHAVARLPSREEPPGAIRARIDVLRFGQRARPRWRMVALTVGPVAAAVVAVWGGLTVRNDTQAARLADELVMDHLHSVPEVRPAEIASSDRNEIMQFFVDHLPFRPLVPDVPGTQLIGARLCQIGALRVELLFYQREARTLSLFVTDQPIASDRCWSAHDHHVCGRSIAQVSMLLVGQLPADELRRLLDESAL